MTWQPKYIDKVGAELEGGWSTEPTSGRYHHDGSVTVRAPIVGEFVSDPLPAQELLDWVTNKEVYPQFINTSCGLHVHISLLDDGDYARIMSKKFRQDFKAEMDALGYRLGLPTTHQFWSRLRGRNSFCRDEFNPDQQWQDTGKNHMRYSQLNYCYSLHGTMECRLFPMFESRRTAGQAIKGLLEFVDKWIGNARRSRTTERETMKIELPLETAEEVLDMTDPMNHRPMPRRSPPLEYLDDPEEPEEEHEEDEV